MLVCTTLEACAGAGKQMRSVAQGAPSRWGPGSGCSPPGGRPAWQEHQSEHPLLVEQGFATCHNSHADCAAGQAGHLRACLQNLQGRLACMSRMCMQQALPICWQCRELPLNR